MTLPAGTRLGPYEIRAPLGAGGMGEVYRARDERLKREVAIKVLPASYSSDPDRLRRFEQEAQAAGALNHPNITAVYDFGSHEGAPYIVTELLEGETLRARLAASGIGVRKAIDYAVQIARGLAAAHEKGIVHRDLKPENLFLTSDGRVKILDFGLAKLTQPDAGAALQTNLPTAAAGTEPGVVMGTLGYMSPSRSREGRRITGRTSSRSGPSCTRCCREFARFSANPRRRQCRRSSRTSRRTSPGRTRTCNPGSTVWCATVSKRTPRSGFNRAPTSPSTLRHSPGLGPTEAGQGMRRPPPHGEGRFSRRLRPSSWPSWRGCSWAPGSERTRRPSSFVPQVDAPEGLRRFRPLRGGRPHGLLRGVLGRGAEAAALLDPAGESRVPVARSAEWARRGDLPHGRDADLSDTLFSFGYAHRGVLRSAPLSGGAARDLFEDVVGADWTPDGRSIALVRAPDWRHRLEFPAGKVVYQTTGWLSHPRVSPSGDAVAFLDHPQFGDDGGSVALIDRNGRRATLSKGWVSVQGLAWAPSGKEIGLRRSIPGTATRSMRSRAPVSSASSARLRGVRSSKTSLRTGASCSTIPTSESASLASAPIRSLGTFRGWIGRSTRSSRMTGKRWSLPKKKMAMARLISARPTVRRRCDWAKERFSLCLPTASGSSRRCRGSLRRP